MSDCARFFPVLTLSSLLRFVTRTYTVRLIVGFSTFRRSTLSFETHQWRLSAVCDVTADEQIVNKTLMCQQHKDTLLVFVFTQE